MSRSTKWLVIAFAIVIIFMLLRARALAPASIVSGLLIMATLGERWYRLLLARRASRYQEEIFQRMQGGNPDGGAVPSAQMTVEQAMEVLGIRGVVTDVTEDEVTKSYHRLIRVLHPDQGGSGYLTAQVNQARDIMLKEVRLRSGD